MVDHEQLLISVAEIAVAIAGFSGIASALRHDTADSWSRADRERFENLVIHSGIALFASLVSLLFAARTGFDEGFWATFSLTWAGFGAGGLVVSVRRSWGRARAWGVVNTLVVGAFAGMIAFQLINGLWWDEFWPYFSGLLLNLAFAFMQFVALAWPGSPDDA